MTGVTVALFEGENRGGIDICGGGPASRETQLLSPLTDDKTVHGLVFSGGSAYGLGAADGVMTYLEERSIGYPVLETVVPLVLQSCIFDLNIGSGTVRPDAQMAYAACTDAEGNRPRSGVIGAGTGATIGKIGGMAQSQKSGIGYYAVKVGRLQVGAMVVVNAVGDIYDHRTGQKIVGMLTPDRKQFADAERMLCLGASQINTASNTTLAALFTNAAFDTAEMNKIASMARSGMARAIRPINTMADGDTIYAFSLGSEPADINIVGTLAANVLAEAILDAVRSVFMTDEAFLAKIKG